MDLSELDLTEEEQRYYPPKKFKAMLGCLKRVMDEGGEVSQAFINLKYPILQPRSGDFNWKIIALNGGVKISPNTPIHYIDFLGNIGAAPQNEYREEGRCATLSEVVNAFAGAELQLAVQSKCIDPPFSTLFELLVALEKNGLKVELEDSLESDIRSFCEPQKLVKEKAPARRAKF